VALRWRTRSSVVLWYQSGIALLPKEQRSRRSRFSRGGYSTCAWLSSLVEGTSLQDDPDAKGLPASVQREFYDYLQCGILAYGFLRLEGDSCQKEILLAFSCKRRGFCPSGAG
jgi:hypothetical protein